MDYISVGSTSNRRPSLPDIGRRMQDEDAQVPATVRGHWQQTWSLAVTGGWF